MNEIMVKQLALDYCCSEDEVRDRKNHLTVWKPLEGRRMFDESEDGCFLRIAVFNGKLLITGDSTLLSDLQPIVKDYNGAWFMDATALAIIHSRLVPYGWKIEQFREFFIAENISSPCTSDYDFQWYTAQEIDQFKGDERFDEAFAFSPKTPDVLGLSAMKNDVIVGMAGASEDCPFLWQIGVNILQEYESKGISSMLVSLIKNEIIRRGKIPYYGTAMSHLASQRVALRAGFLPAWTELVTSRISSTT